MFVSIRMCAGKDTGNDYLFVGNEKLSSGKEITTFDSQPNSYARCVIESSAYADFVKYGAIRTVIRLIRDQYYVDSTLLQNVSFLLLLLIYSKQTAE